MTIFTDGLREQHDIGIDELNTGLGDYLGARAEAAAADWPLNRISDIAELSRAGEASPALGAMAGFLGGQVGADWFQPRPDLPEISREAAQQRVKEAGLEKAFKLPDRDTIKVPALDIMISRARENRERESVIARGPDGFVAGALSVGTSFLVGAMDPLNMASAFIPVVGEARYAKLLADAGASVFARAGVRAGVGAAEGAVGMAALEPIQWYAKTQEGGDYTLAHALHSVIFGAALGAGLRTGGGAIADVVRGRQGRPVYPFDFREPHDVFPAYEALQPEPEPFLGSRSFAEASARSRLSEAIADLPPRAQEDVLRASIANLVNGEPVRAGEMLDAARGDPRIAESLDVVTRPEAHPAARSIRDDITEQLRATGMDEAQVSANAAIVAARYATRAERMGVDARELYASENISVQKFGAESVGVPGRTFMQDQPRASTFYSAVERAVTDAKQDRAPGDQWLGMLRNRPGVKPEEMEWLGLESWLKEQKGPVTKAQVQDFIRANQIEVKEVTKGEPAQIDVLIAERNRALAAGDHARADELSGDIADIEHGMFDEKPTETKFSQWQLPGGENYRELLLTLPERDSGQLPIGWKVERRGGEYKVIDDKGFVVSASLDEATAVQSAMATVKRVKIDSDNYRSSHWDEPNVLAHIRFNDRTIDGKKTLFIEEIQSDWHQAGKRKGYGPAEGPRGWGDTHGGTAGGVPDAPFKTTWPELSLKRMIRYAAENGYDKIAWTPGHVQADRYDLSKQVDSIATQREPDGHYRIEIYRVGSGRVESIEKSAQELPDFIGKDLADKVIAHHEPNNDRYFGRKVWSDIDLKVGGEGMSGFYDKILPAAANKLVKKYGVKVGEGKLPVPKEFVLEIGDVGERAARAETVHTLDINPTLRDAAMSEGFPLFQRSGEGEPRGRITLADNKAVIDLFGKADQSTFMHESAHLWLDEMVRDAAHSNVPQALKDDLGTILRWLGVDKAEDIGVPQHEQWARGFEQYLADGKAPSNALAQAFESFKQWLAAIYRSLRDLGTPINDDIRGVMDRMLASDAQIAERQKPQTWADLAQARPDHADPVAVASAKAAEEMPEPGSVQLADGEGDRGALATERLTGRSASAKAAAESEARFTELYDAAVADGSIGDKERAQIDEVLQGIDQEASTKAQVLRQGAGCLIAGLGLGI